MTCKQACDLLDRLGITDAEFCRIAGRTRQTVAEWRRPWRAERHAFLAEDSFRAVCVRLVLDATEVHRIVTEMSAEGAATTSTR